MSNRTTPQEGEKTAESRPAPDFSKFMVCDSFSNSISSPAAGGEEHRRLSRQQLEEVEGRLSERDKQILIATQRYRYLLTTQIQRLFFMDATTPTAAYRATARAVKRLKELGVIDHLARRIGGVRAGSGGLVWYLTHAGERVLRLREQSVSPVRRFFEPSPFFLAHTLAVAEVAVRLTELCREGHKMRLTTLQPEPDCWRTYSEYGSMLSLKPDLFAITVSGQYEDRWFIEVDLDTESLNKIIDKCERYHKYYRSGLEQQEAGVFPLTVWIVPTVERKNKLINCITGMGYWTRANAEICLLATRGQPKRQARNVHQVIISHVEEHSKKPDEARRRIELLMGDVSRVELFARQHPPGWDVWGNEVESTVELSPEKEEA